MAGIFTDYWKIVKPRSNRSLYAANSTEAAKLYSNVSWYSGIMKGSQSRFSKYTQYKGMDSDVFVQRALDTVAEEMTSENSRTGIPFEIEYQNESNSEVSETVTMTVRAALRHWCDSQQFNKNLFDIARTTIKFGDCFFRKTSDLKRWQYLDPLDVIGISMDDNGNAEHYYVRDGAKNSAGAYGDSQVIPAAGIVHFSLTSNMGETGPFGESVLQSCVKAYRHLTLLEDSVIIYRIVRAPERRVFFVDVGNMPPQRVKAYLESIKNEINQKRIPNTAGGTDKLDSVYNPMCLTLDTMIPLLDGRVLPLTSLITEHLDGRQNWAYSTDPESGKIVPGLISWAGITRKNTEIVKITLDNGKTITCTPDHKFPTLNRGFVQAIDLLSTDSLFSYETRDKKIGTGSKYQQVFDHESNTWKFTHRIVGEFFKSINKHQELTFSPEFEGEDKNVVHHKDYSSKNNHPSNLQWMNKADHMLYHRLMKKEWWSAVKDDPARLAALKHKIADGLVRYYSELPVDERKKLSLNAATRINEWTQRLSQDPAWVEKITASRKLAGKNRSDRMKNDHAFKERITFNLTKHSPKFINKSIKVTRDVVGRLAQLVSNQDLDHKQAIKVGATDAVLSSYLVEANKDTIGAKGVKFAGKLSEKVLKRIYSEFNYSGWKHFKQASNTYNHRIVSVEVLAEKQDTGCITIDGEHKYHAHHTFALEAGVFTKNSTTEDFYFAQTAEGRGSRVETLPGGENLGEIADLNFFQNKFLQGLRIPSSYMRGGADGGIAIADGKVGVAYIEELRFANYCMRLQRKLIDTFSNQFKSYLKSAGINVDPRIFKLKLPDPQDFADYKQAEVDEKRLSNYSNVKDDKTISMRMKQRMFLGWTEDQIQENEALRKQEEGIPDGGLGEGFSETRMLYDSKYLENRPDIKLPESYDNFESINGEEKEEPLPEEPGKDEDQDLKDPLSAELEPDKEADPDKEAEPANKSADEIKDEIEKL